MLQTMTTGRDQAASRSEESFTSARVASPGGVPSRLGGAAHDP